MTAVQWVDVFQHWFYSGTLAFIGVLFLLRPACFAATCPYFNNLRGDADIRVRIMEASVRRKAMENVSPSLGYYVAAISFALAILGAVTWQQPALWYAIECLAIAAAISIAFLQLRSAQRIRVAVLCARTPSSVIHPAWGLVAVLCALSPLGDLPNPSLRLTAAIVVVASLCIAYVAWRVTMMPAMMEGVDIPAEQFVDERLRAQRSSRILLLAMIVPFVYLAQTSVVHAPARSETLVHACLEAATLVAWLAFQGMLNRQNKRGPSVLEWKTAAP